MNPVRGIETYTRGILVDYQGIFQINESRSRDWNTQVVTRQDADTAFKLMNPVRGIETKNAKTRRKPGIILSN